MNLKEWIKLYYTVYEKINLKPGTLRSYLSCLSRVPEEWEIETFNRIDLQLLINKLTDELASSTVKHIYHVISKSIREAPFYGYADRSAELNRVKLPSISRKIIHSLTESELNKLFVYINRSVYKDAYIILLNTGMRFGELAGLNTSDFDLQNRTLRIERNYYRGRINQTTKTAAGIRVIPLNKTAFDAVLRNLHVGPGILIPNRKGERLKYNTVITDWHNICDFAGIERCGLHVLRHTFATQMLTNDVPMKVVSTLLGHKSITITADIYTDVPLKLKRQAIDKIDLMCFV